MDVLIEKIFYNEAEDPVILIEEILPLIGNIEKLRLLKTIIYVRSPRIGLGSKQRGLEMIRGFINVDPIFFVEHLPMYVYYCCWKDLRFLLDTSIRSEIINLWARQLQRDLESSSISLAAKWIPSEKSPEDRKFHCFGSLAKAMGITKAQLRKNYLIPLRKRLDITEHHINLKEYHKIDYFKISKRARSKYHHLFMKHDRDRYIKYLETVQWFWLPNSYWNPSEIPELKNLTFSSNLNEVPEIFFVLDTSSMMHPIPIQICSALIEEIYLKYQNQFKLYLASYSNEMQIKPLSGKLEDCYSSFTSEVNIKEGISKLRKKYPASKILVFTSNYAIVNINQNYVPDLWWSISHNPVEIDQIQNKSANSFHVISGYDSDFYQMLIQDLNVDRKKYLELKFNKISTLTNFRSED